MTQPGNLIMMVVSSDGLHSKRNQRKNRSKAAVKMKKWYCKGNCTTNFLYESLSFSMKIWIANWKLEEKQWQTGDACKYCSLFLDCAIVRKYRSKRPKRNLFQKKRSRRKQRLLMSMHRSGSLVQIANSRLVGTFSSLWSISLVYSKIPSTLFSECTLWWCLGSSTPRLYFHSLWSLT